VESRRRSEVFSQRSVSRRSYSLDAHEGHRQSYWGSTHVQSCTESQPHTTTNLLTFNTEITCKQNTSDKQCRIHQLMTKVMLSKPSKRSSASALCSDWHSTGSTCPDCNRTMKFRSQQTSHMAPSAWHRLPPALWSPDLSESVFKRALKTHLFSTARRHWDVFMILAPDINIEIHSLAYLLKTRGAVMVELASRPTSARC